MRTDLERFAGKDMAYLATVAAFGFADFNPPTLLPIYRRLGCRAGQFYRNVDNPPRLAEARRIAEDAGLPFDSVHGVFGPAYDPSSPDEKVRQFAVETYRKEGELANELGGPRVVVHPSPRLADGEVMNEAGKQARYAALTKSIEELAAIGQRDGVTFMIENIPSDYYVGSDVSHLGEMIRRFDHPNIRMCFDTGHAHMTSAVGESLAAVVDVVGYLHIHDNDGERDSHEIPGVSGDLPWTALTASMAKLDGRTGAMLELFYSEEEIQAQIEAGLGDRLRAWLCLDG